MADRVQGRTDEDLLSAVRQGHVEALEALILRYQPRVFRFGMRMCGDREDAGDVVQETMLAMARSLREFRGEASVATWLYTIARSVCIKKRRRSTFAPAREESLDGLDAGQRDVPDPAPDPEQAALGREIEAALAAAIDALDAGQREVLVLRDIEGLSAPEVGTVLGLSVDAVKSRLHRARLAVRQQVAPVLGIAGNAPPSTTACPDVLELFSRYLEGEISPDVCTQMQAHLERCEPCRGSCASLRRTIALCRATPAVEVPRPVADAVRDAIRSFIRHQGPDYSAL